MELSPPISNFQNEETEKKQEHVYHEASYTDATTPPGQPPTSGVPLPPKDWKPPRKNIFQLAGSKLNDIVRKNPYDHITTVEPQTDQDNHIYEKVERQRQNSFDGDLKTRLQTIEETQITLCREFHEFKIYITTEIFSLKEMTEKLTNLVSESSTKLQESLEKLNFQFLVNSDHIGKQILDVRRDIVKAKKQSSVSGSSTSIHTHTFEWELVNVDTMVKNQKESSSQVYSILQTGCNINGRVNCSKDGSLRLKIFGELNLSAKSLPLEPVKFDCAVHVIDKSGKHPEWVLGNIPGDFSSTNDWLISVVTVSDVKKKGYLTKGCNINLKFVTDFY